MSLSHPRTRRGRSLHSCRSLLDSLTGASDWFAPARSAVVLLVDGLGRGNLTARAGHARFLVSSMAKRDAARTVFRLRHPLSRAC